MHRAGLANSPISVDAADGLMLIGTRVVAAVRCAPPDNAPTPAERSTCAPWLTAEGRPRRHRDSACCPRRCDAAGLLPPQPAEHVHREADRGDARRRLWQREEGGRYSMTAVLASGASIAGLL